MIINDVAHLMTSPFIVRRSDGAILYDTTQLHCDLPPDVAILEIKSIRSVSFPNYPVIIFDV